MQRSFVKKIKECFFIAFGALVLAFGLVLFLAPMKLSSGGVSTVSTVLLHLFGIPLSYTTLSVNALLFLLGYRFLGKAALVKTAAGVLFLSAFLEIASLFPVYTEDIFISTVIGGIFMGVGLGLVIRQEASTGGSDFAALVLHRFFPHISVSLFILLLDCIIIAAAGLVFHSVTVTVYSGIALFVSMQTTNAILSFGDAAKSLLILSGKTDEISACIQSRFERGTTGIYSRGMYENKDVLMLLSVVSPKELPILLHLVRQIDKNAFVVIFDAREVVGEGFGSGAGYDKIHGR